MLRRGFGGTSLPEFSVSPESASTWLTRFAPRLTLFELPARVYSFTGKGTLIVTAANSVITLE
jgi:hypothetical protein